MGHLMSPPYPCPPRSDQGASRERLGNPKMPQEAPGTPRVGSGMIGSRGVGGVRYGEVSSGRIGRGGVGSGGVGSRCLREAWEILGST